MNDKEKEVFMYAVIALDRIIDEFLKFTVVRRPYIAENMIRAAQLDDDDLDSVRDAVDRVLWTMKQVEEMATGDSAGHRARQHKVQEINSILHISRAFPDKAIKRLKELPNKQLKNV